ncbi:GNAT family N-acetyltransferase [Kallipyga massiliensis]|uniref:GNAT family N-acetyltransferase n=1 Tax=Kallipyga massiliensis TaxID=1472764 RepID=UPI0026EC6867|nr:GNAT family N-acetyltransferase [Kallipyga massiliensis]
MNFRKATSRDLMAVGDIYDRIHDHEEAGLLSTGWIRGVYPTPDTARAALDRGDLYVLVETGSAETSPAGAGGAGANPAETIVAAGVINQVQLPEYREANWQVPADEDEILVLHTLTVDPLQVGHGYGRSFVANYEDLARDQGMKALRMDTNALNQRARALYRKLGYREVGQIPTVFNGIDGVMLVLLEKVLSE